VAILGQLVDEHVALAAIAWLLAAALPGPCSAEEAMQYSGPCDASAAAALDGEHFVAGNDESNTLHVYRRGQARAAGELNLSKFLGTRTDDESDIEGAASVGTRTYWITSHARNSRGKARQDRHRFFATEVIPGHPPSLRPVGEPYTRLLNDIEASDALKPYRLVDASRLAAEAEGGLNIEGLAATPDGRLLIGLRNPLPHQHSLVIPLQNPAELIEGKRAKFGTPIELDLDRRGIRSITLVGSAYLIVAGPTADRGSFALYRWSGRTGDAATPVAGVELGNLRPEAAFAIPQTGRVQLLSDDGGVIAGGVACKRLPATQQTFRSLIVTP
jgi:hypothetical protein